MNQTEETECFYVKSGEKYEPCFKQ
jgi:hypothetical protein